MLGFVIGRSPIPADIAIANFSVWAAGGPAAGVGSWAAKVTAGAWTAFLSGGTAMCHIRAPPRHRAILSESERRQNRTGQPRQDKPACPGTRHRCRENPADA